MVKVELTPWGHHSSINGGSGEEENTNIQEVKKVFLKPIKAELSVYFNYLGSNK